MKLVQNNFNPTEIRVFSGSCSVCKSVFEAPENELKVISNPFDDAVDFANETCTQCGGLVHLEPKLGQLNS